MMNKSVIILAALLVVCAWSWAQLYRPPAHWKTADG